MITAGLLLLGDARFPTGGHAHSAGTEAAVAIGDVHDLASLDRYLHARLGTTGVVDAAFAAAACAAASFDDLDDLDEEYTARTPSPYLRSVSRRMGRQLVRAAARTWRSDIVDLVAATPDGPHQPIALGACAAAAGAEPADAAVLAFHHLAGAVASSAIRLLGLDPVDVAALQAAATATAVDRILLDRPWEVGTAAELPAVGGTLTEILGERHGSLAARLFVA